MGGLRWTLQALGEINGVSALFFVFPKKWVGLQLTLQALGRINGKSPLFFGETKNKGDFPLIRWQIRLFEMQS